MSINSFSEMLVSRLGGFLFIIGKALRFVFFLIFLLLLTSQTKKLAGYTINATVFFFLTFNFIDTITQFLFREVYRFRSLVVSGELDYVLTKPSSPLFRSLLGGADLFDLVMIIPFGLSIIFLAMSFKPTIGAAVIYVFLLLFGIGIAGAIHILVLGLGIITTEIDHAIMIYRDITSTGRVPVDIYQEPIRGFLTFVIPVGIMMTLPAKAIIGLVSWQGILLSFVIFITSLFLSLKFWHYALNRYSSASS